MSKLLRGLITAGILVISSASANAGLIGDSIDTKDRFGTQTAIVGLGSETRTAYDVPFVSNFFNLSDDGFTLGLVNSSSSQFDWSVTNGDFWEVLGMDSVGDSSAVITSFSQVSGQSLHTFVTSFSDHSIRVDMGTLTFSVPSGEYGTFDFAFNFGATSVPEPATLSLLVFGLLGLTISRKKQRCDQI